MIANTPTEAVEVALAGNTIMENNFGKPEVTDRVLSGEAVIDHKLTKEEKAKELL